MEEKTIKKLWLAFLIFGNLLALVSALSFYFFKSTVQDPTILRILDNSLVGFLSIGTFLTIFFSIALFFCALREPGTDLLTFSLFCQLIYLIVGISSIDKSMVYVRVLQEADVPKNIISFVDRSVLIGVLSQLVWAVFGGFSLKLRSINKRAQFKQVRFSSEYSAIFESIENESDFEELDRMYQEAVKEHPRINNFLKMAFSNKKTELSQKSYSSGSAE